MPVLTCTFVGMMYRAFECSNPMSASNGERKKRSVNIRQPRAKMSTFSLIGKPEYRSICSGAWYSRVVYLLISSSICHRFYSQGHRISQRCRQ